MRGITGAALAALLTLEHPAPAAHALAQAAAPFPVVPIETPAHRRHTWAYLSMVGGVGLMGLSFTISHRADDAYATYLVSTDQEQIQVLYDRAVHNDHLAQGSLLTGEALVVVGLYLRFIRRPAPSRVSVSLLPSRCTVSFRF